LRGLATRPTPPRGHTTGRASGSRSTRARPGCTCAKTLELVGRHLGCASRRMNEEQENGESDQHVDREHEEDPAVAEVERRWIEEELGGNEDGQWDRDGLGRRLQTSEDPRL